MDTLPRVLCSSDASSPATASTRTRASGGVGLLGCGTVGAGVARRFLASHPGLIRAIAVRDPHKPRDLAWGAFSDDAFDVVDDPSVRVVVECIGGLGLARELVLRAIARGKDVVTANKDLIATEGPWLAAFAERTGASLRYEAAVGGAIPIVRALQGALAAEDVLEIGGVLNGTTNFVLDAMEHGAEYADALAEAQRLGFAEADPRADVDGHDAAHKLAILAGLAFRRPALSPSFPRRGIAAISRDDVRAGAERGLRLKLVAVARREGASIEAGVTPAFVSARASVRAAARCGERRSRAGPRLRPAHVLRCGRRRRCDGVGGRRRRARGVRRARSRRPRTSARISSRGRCARRCWCGSRGGAS